MIFCVLRAAVFAGLAVLMSIAPVLAQERSPAERQTLVELAYVLGESHALRQACAPGDQYWRGRMRLLVAAEQPDEPFNRRLADAFNDGFVASQQAFPACNAASRQEAARVAAKGRDLTESLSEAVAEDSPTR